MALLVSSHFSVATRNPNPFRLLSPRQNSELPFHPVSRRSPRLASFPAPSVTYGGGELGAFPGEGRRRHRKHPKERPSEDEAEDPQGVEAGPIDAAAGIPDEWGERAEPEVDPPGEPDPPMEEDEWGRDPGNGSGQAAPAEDKLGDLKRCLVDTFYGTEYGLRTSAEVRAEVLELVSQLEAENPIPAPVEAVEVLEGNWILMYTAFSELLPLIAVGTTPLLKIKRISQAIDTKSFTIVNATTLTSPFASFSFSASASFEVRSPSRIQVRFKEGTFDPPVISSSVDLPENVDVFGQKIDLLPLQRTLNPVQEAVANIARVISGQPPLKVPIPGDRTASWLLTTFLDKDLRISRGDGGLFVLAKEGSPLLDQVS
uniref:Putative plastid-lipid-associated protein 3, chloroplastic n=1 Tax=Anthurium amnicola TaxID=1678845 RepID=A0A1D1Z848_9ARAE